jgi:hypothetical protein
MSVKKIELLLKNQKLILSKIYKFESNFSSKEFEKIENIFLSPPKSALLKMSQVSRLHKLKYKKKWTKNDYILVIEPQNYNKVTKLTPKNMMFEKNYVLKEKNNHIVGYFHSGKSGFAHSGDGGDYGDSWWLANDTMERWLIRIIKKGNKILENLIKKSD